MHLSCCQKNFLPKNLQKMKCCRKNFQKTDCFLKTPAAVLVQPAAQRVPPLLFARHLPLLLQRVLLLPPLLLRHVLLLPWQYVPFLLHRG